MRLNYQAVEPENRLLPKRRSGPEEKLQAQQALEEEYHRVLQQQPRILTNEERDAIRQLAADIPALWNAPTTTDADRKEIIRQVVERVAVDAQGTSEQVRVRITWAGGGQTEGVLIRPLARYTQRMIVMRDGRIVKDELVPDRLDAAEELRKLEEEHKAVQLTA